MAHDARRGLLTLPSTVDIVPGYRDARQWILAAAAARRRVLEALGTGVWLGGATELADLGDGTTYPAVTAVAPDDEDQAWCCASGVAVDIDFNVTSTAAGEARLYLVPGQMSGVSPAAATGDETDYTVVADDVANGAPAHSLLLGSGTIADSAVTAFTEDDDARRGAALLGIAGLRFGEDTTGAGFRLNGDQVEVSHDGETWSKVDSGDDMTSFDLSGDSGDDEEVTDGDTVSVLGDGTSLKSIVTPTDTVTVYNRYDTKLGPPDASYTLEVLHRDASGAEFKAIYDAVGYGYGYGYGYGSDDWVQTNIGELDAHPVDGDFALGSIWAGYVYYNRTDGVIYRYDEGWHAIHYTPDEVDGLFAALGDLADLDTVGADEIDDGAVTGAKLASGAVTGAKLASGAVTASKIGSGAVTEAKLGADCVTGDKVADDAIDTEHIADDAVGADQIDEASEPTVAGLTVTGSLVLSGDDPAMVSPGTSDGSDDKALHLAGGGGATSSRGACVNAYGNEHATQPGNLYLQAGNDAGGGIAYLYTYGTARMIVNLQGEVQFPAVYADVVGGTNRDLYIDDTGKIGYVSSRRGSKKNVRPIDESQTAFLYELAPKVFDRPDGTTDEMGLIAEEVDELGVPGLVSYARTEEAAEVDEEGRRRVTLWGEDKAQPETVNYSRLIVPLLAELQRLAARVAELEAKR